MHFVLDLVCDLTWFLQVRVDGSKDTITAEVTFTASPTFSSITLENHLVNGYNLTDLILFLDGKHTLDNMGDHLEEAIQSSQDSNMVLEGNISCASIDCSIWKAYQEIGL